ncbi:MAG: tRNA (adenosine(37)-N6)-threonylcarbamoyltransferase complex ATPase subunit type 1 TsaE [Saprospiraceae bacterium]|nr:tRNA (adenosine(37)-N6)-threonylcarbamoyltransferase complex ATPase subunit type 1 TsaE [Saprospiraceae bacterium]
MLEINITSIVDWDNAAAQLITWAGERRKFAFYGEIGAGKTTFIQAICRYLGVGDYVASPTFALVHEYAGSGANRVFHLDLYRLRNIQEALDIGIEEYLDSPDYCFIEWPEIIEPLLPEDIVRVKIAADSNSHRKVVIL